MAFFLSLILISSFKLGDIKIVGLRWTTEEFVKAKFGLSVGTDVTNLEIRNGFKRLYSGDFFEDIKLYGRLASDSSLILTMNITENPRLLSFSFKNNEKIKDRELIDSLGIYEGIAVSKRRIFNWKTVIKELYRKKDYLKVDVDVRSTPPDDEGRIEIIFDIKEGESFRIREINIEGNSYFSDEKLEMQMKNREKTWYRKAKFNEEEWLSDPGRIEEFYHNNGFPKAEIDSTHFEYKEGRLYITIYLTEGKRYLFGELSFEGNTIFDGAFLESVSRLRAPPLSLTKRLFPFFKGKVLNVYSKKRLDEAIANIAGVYGDSGYIYVQVVPVEDISNDSFIDITFKISEGERAKVRQVEIVGNTRTFDPVIRREIDILPGSYFSRALLVKSQRDLFFLNYFEDIKLNFKQTPDSGYIDLVFDVKEKPTGTVGAGASYSQIGGPSIYFQMQQPNLMGRGQRVSLMLEYGSRRQNYQIGFTEPWLGGKPYSLGFDLHYYTIELPGEYTERRQGGSVTFSRPLWNDYWRIGISYSLERLEFSNITLDELSAYFGGRFRSTSTITITRDSRDRSFNATRGSRVSYSLQLSGGVLGGDVLILPFFTFLSEIFYPKYADDIFDAGADYHMHIGEVSYYLPIFRKFITVPRIKAGFASGYNQLDKVPTDILFKLGDIGPYGLRGYEYRSVGPGRIFTIASVEERLRFSDMVYILLFAEAGATWDRFEDINREDIKRSAGVGFRMEIPMMGVMGIDLGYGFDNNGGKLLTHFQLGSMF